MWIQLQPNSFTLASGSDFQKQHPPRHPRHNTNYSRATALLVLFGGFPNNEEEQNEIKPGIHTTGFRKGQEGQSRNLCSMDDQKGNTDGIRISLSISTHIIDCINEL